MADDTLSITPEVATTTADHEDESTKKKTKKSVGFQEQVSIRVLPSEEAEDALGTRKGEWGSAPDHDELWDGDMKDFWEQEKSLEEVHRIVVLRQLRLTLQYNLGFAFYAMVANFKRRRNCLFPDDVVPEFETSESEDIALRKELREVFQDSIRGLEFPDIMQDRIAFEKIYAALLPGLSGIETLIDELMDVKDLCELMSMPLSPGGISGANPPEQSFTPVPTTSIDDAVDKEEKRRENQRAVFEANNNGIPAYGERRASVEARRLAEALQADQELAALKVAENALPAVPEETHNSAEGDSPSNQHGAGTRTLPPPEENRTSHNQTSASLRPSQNAPPSGNPLEAKRFEFLKSTGTGATASEVRIFSDVFEGTTIGNEDRIKYSQRFVREGITSVKHLAGLSTADLTSFEVKVFDAKQIVRRSWVLTRKV